MSLVAETPRSTIRRLPAGVVNKIAAGEVIERPASVVKELLENAIDAAATRIDVAVEQGGLDLIRIVDNGCGIAAEELPLAVASHATSKIADADDLFRVASLGFRGEALASIAEVSRLAIRSRVAHAGAGAELTVAGGAAGETTPCGAAVGTAVEVRNLFFNTPVRRKFLRATQTEMAHVSEAFTRLALAYPRIHFTLAHGGKSLYDLPPTDGLATRIAGIFGEELAGELIHVDSRDGALRLTGYVARPSQSRANPRLQYLFLNGRSIRDRALQHALGEAYRGLLLSGRYPICFLQLEMPPEDVDVNVHPTKLEVRFQDGGRVYSLLLGALRTRFLTMDLTAKLHPHGPAGQASQFNSSLTAEQRLADWMARPGDDRGDGQVQRTVPLGTPADFSRPGSPLSLHKLDRPADRNWPTHPSGQPGQVWNTPATAAIQPRPTAEGEETGGGGSTASGDWQPLATADRPFPSDNLRPPAIQVHNRYLIAESDDGIVIIDQHALHERILYEQIREKVLAGAMESQRLLVPEPVNLGPAEAAALLAAADTLARLGVHVEPFGGDTVLITSYPAMLANFRPVEVLRELVDKLTGAGRQPERRDLLDDLLHMIACKAAIKAGDRLTQEEIAALVQERHAYQDAHHCPHGRPTSLVFTRADLDRQFMRT